jgi:hypothetical protein
VLRAFSHTRSSEQKTGATGVRHVTWLLLDAVQNPFAIDVLCHAQCKCKRWSSNVLILLFFALG